MCFWKLGGADVLADPTVSVEADESHLRPMSEDEKKRVAEEIAGTRKLASKPLRWWQHVGPAAFASVLLVVVCLGIGELLADQWPEFSKVVALLGLILCLPVFLLVLLAVIRQEQRNRQCARRRAEGLQADLEEGLVAVTLYRPITVVHIPDREHSGRCYVYRIAGKRAIIMWYHDKDQCVPADCFELYSLPKSGWVLDDKPLGQLMAPAKMLDYSRVIRSIHPFCVPFDLDWDAFLRGEVKI